MMVGSAGPPVSVKTRPMSVIGGGEPRRLHRRPLPIGQSEDRMAREADEVDVRVDRHELEVPARPHRNAENHSDNQPQRADGDVGRIDRLHCTPRIGASTPGLFG